MTSPIVRKLLEQRYANEALAEFEEDFTPSSVGLWEMAQEKATKKFGHFPTAEGLDYAFGWYNLKEGYWITYLDDEELEEFFQLEEDDLSEGTLHHWFKGSKSKDGKPGWVQADGSPCANEEGETKTPKCFSSGRLAALKRKGKKGESKIKSAVRRKREEDPGQQQKSGGAKPTNVKTFAKGKKDKDYVKAEPKLKKEETELQEKKDIKGKGSGSKDACYHKVKARFKVWPSAYASGALVKCRQKGAANWGKSTKKEDYDYIDEMSSGKVRGLLRGRSIQTQKAANKYLNSKDDDGSKLRSAMRKERRAEDAASRRKKRKAGEGDGALDALRSVAHDMKEESISEMSDRRVNSMLRKRERNLDKAMDDNHNSNKSKSEWTRDVADKMSKADRAQDAARRRKNRLTREGYAPGDVDQKVGAVTSIPKDEREAARQRILAKALAAKKKREMKKEDTSEMDAQREQRILEMKQRKIAELSGIKQEEIEEERIAQQNGNMLMVTLTWKGKYLGMKVFFPEIKMPTRSEVQAALDKVYPGCMVRHYVKTFIQPQDPYLNVGVDEEVEFQFTEEERRHLSRLELKMAKRMHDMDPKKKRAVANKIKKMKVVEDFVDEEVESVEEDWQKVNKSDKTDGMSKKAVAAYRRENPGSKLKTAVTGNPKRGSKDAKRRKSFCARSKGQQDMHNIDCSKTPDKPVCKARRRWKC